MKCLMLLLGRTAWQGRRVPNTPRSVLNPDPECQYFSTFIFRCPEQGQCSARATRGLFLPCGTLRVIVISLQSLSHTWVGACRLYCSNSVPALMNKVANMGMACTLQTISAFLICQQSLYSLKNASFS